MLAKFLLIIYTFNLFVNYSLTYPQLNSIQITQVKLWMTISAKSRVIEVSWINAPLQSGDKIIITNNTINYESGNPKFIWNNNVIATVHPDKPDGWVQTKNRYNFELSKSVTISTSCYGYWAYYIDQNNKILGTGCYRAYPKWMNDMRPNIEQFSITNLMIPATHDSGSYDPNSNSYKSTSFFPPITPTDLIFKAIVVSKDHIYDTVDTYSLTQDDDIRTQLMHGIRHLDIRVGYVSKIPWITKEEFYITHGPTKQIKLIEAIQHVKNFVRESNEIVIFDVHEFTDGFTEEIHKKLVKFLLDNFGSLLIDPSLSWHARLSEIWAAGQNVFLSYNHGQVQYNNQQNLFSSVAHRWANKIQWTDLETYLRSRYNIPNRYVMDKPVADMAALTLSDGWEIVEDIASNKYGGLRGMADSINKKVSKLYREELGESANIVAVDFYRGTTIVDISIDSNYAKIF